MTGRFTDGKRRIATAHDLTRPWSCGRPGEKFRCYLCGVRFKEGDGWRWQYAAGASFEAEGGRRFGVTNFVVCDACDGPDVIERWAALNREFHGPKFWALRG